MIQKISLLIIVLTMSSYSATGLAQSVATNGLVKSQGSHAHSGAWMVYVNPDPTSGIPQILNVAVFTNDGKIINVDADGSAGVGLWKAIGQRKARVTFIESIIQDGQPVILKVRGLAQLNKSADQFDGPFKTQIYDSAGKQILEFEGTIHATRFRIEPLD